MEGGARRRNIPGFLSCSTQPTQSAMAVLAEDMDISETLPLLAPTSPHRPQARLVCVDPKSACIVVLLTCGKRLVVYDAREWDTASDGGVPVSHEVMISRNTGGVSGLCFLGPGSTEVVVWQFLPGNRLWDMYIMNIAKGACTWHPSNDLTVFKFKDRVMNVVADTDLIVVETHERRAHVLQRVGKGVWTRRAWPLGPVLGEGSTRRARPLGPVLREGSSYLRHVLPGARGRVFAVTSRSLDVFDVFTGTVVETRPHAGYEVLMNTMQAGDGSLWIRCDHGRLTCACVHDGKELQLLSVSPRVTCPVNAEAKFYPSAGFVYLDDVGFLGFGPGSIWEGPSPWLAQTAAQACARAFKPYRHAWLSAVSRTRLVRRV